MIFLLFSILSSTAIAIIFKILDKSRIKLFPVIVLNYFTATLFGIILNKTDFNITEIIHNNWIYSGLLIGILLIAGFYLIGYATQKIGIAVTTISNKMSVIIPILFSILFFAETVSSIKIIGIFLSLIAIAFSSFQKKNVKIDYKFIYLPILLFVVIGLIDSLVKFSQSNLSEETIPIFTILTFGIAGITGIIISFFNKTKLSDFFNLKIIFSGILLGSTNFASIYFLIFSLNKSNLDSSVVFGINHIGIISLSILFAFFVFKEKLKLINWLGIVLAIIAVILILQK